MSNLKPFVPQSAVLCEELRRQIRREDLEACEETLAVIEGLLYRYIDLPEVDRLQRSILSEPEAGNV